MIVRPLFLAAVSTVLLATDQAGQHPAPAVPSSSAPTRIFGLLYPRLAHLAAVQGRVELEAVISMDGAVNEVKTISGHPLLVDAAKASLRRWRFKPCAPTVIQCSARATFVFVLESGICELPYCPNEVLIDLPATITITSKPAKAIIN